jgi:SAM-dependent methyltransferase
MNWKVKAALQHAVSLLPSEMSFELYYGMQRTLGTLRSVNPVEGFQNGLRLIAAAEAGGGTVKDKVILEVGTGRRLNVPIAFWLCGAAQTITVDLNRYLKSRLILEDISFIRSHRAEVQKLFGDRADCDEFQRRFAVLLRDGLDVPRLLGAAAIQYIAPQDAQNLPLERETVDYHVSNNVLEHIHPHVLRDILFEGKRVVKRDGLLVHRVDFSDHFSEVDPRVSTINFLRYSENQWRRFAGNRYNYHNRLRIDELESLIADTGLVIGGEHPEIDPVARRILESGFALDPRFAGKATDVNATQSVVMVLARRVSAKGSSLTAAVPEPSSRWVSQHG